MNKIHEHELELKNYLLEKLKSIDNITVYNKNTDSGIVVFNIDNTDYLENIKTETLILWGDKDTATPLSDGVLMKKKIRDSELIVFKNSTHYSYLENLDIVLRIIYIFFKKK